MRIENLFILHWYINWCHLCLVDVSEVKLNKVLVISSFSIFILNVSLNLYLVTKVKTWTFTYSKKKTKSIIANINTATKRTNWPIKHRSITSRTVTREATKQLFHRGAPSPAVRSPPSSKMKWSKITFTSLSLRKGWAEGIFGESPKSWGWPQNIIIFLIIMLIDRRTHRRTCPNRLIFVP